jgi:hypothetical protein
VTTTPSTPCSFLEASPNVPLSCSWITPPCSTGALLRQDLVLFTVFRHTLFTFFELVAAFVSVATFTRRFARFGRPPRYPGVVS